MNLKLSGPQPPRGPWVADLVLGCVIAYSLGIAAPLVALRVNLAAGLALAVVLALALTWWVCRR